MSTWTPRIDQVRYNAAEQCFEALVTVVTPQGLLRVASQYAAPVTTDFEEAARGLWMRARLSLGTPERRRDAHRRLICPFPRVRLFTRLYEPHRRAPLVPRVRRRPAGARIILRVPAFFPGNLSGCRGNAE